MTAKNYALLAALVFAIIAALQLVRAIGGWPINVGNVGTTFSGAGLAKLDCFHCHGGARLARLYRITKLSDRALAGTSRSLFRFPYSQSGVQVSARLVRPGAPHRWTDVGARRAV
jgi:hypothetical protein